MGRLARLWLSSWRHKPAESESKAVAVHKGEDSKGLGKLFAVMSSAFSSGATGIMLLATVLTTAMAGASIVYDTILDEDSPLKIEAADLDQGVIFDEEGNFIVEVEIDEHGNITVVSPTTSGSSGDSGNTGNPGSTSNTFSFADVKEAVIDPPAIFSIPQDEWEEVQEEWLAISEEEREEWLAITEEERETWLEQVVIEIEQTRIREQNEASIPTIATPNNPDNPNNSETTNTPEITNAPPEITTAAPEITTAAPEITTAAPEVTTAAPEVTTTPQVTTPAPEVTTTPPVTTTTPSVTTTTPPVTTTTPPVTTTTPPVTTTTPPVTTTTPPVTTTTAPPVTTTRTPPPPQRQNQTGFVINEPSEPLIFGSAPFTLTTAGGQGSGAVTWAITDGDAVSVAADTGVITIEKAGVVTITATKAGDNNYNPTTSTLTLTVGARSMSNAIINVTSTHVYNGTAQTPTITVTDGVSPNLITTADFTVTYSADRTNAGVVTITLTGQGRYTGTKTQDFEIQKRELTVNFTAENKIYDANNSATITSRSIAANLIAGDAVTVTGGVAEFSDRNAGTSKTVTASGFTLTGASANNYIISAINTTTANITAKPITITGVNATNRNFNNTTAITLTGGELQGVEASDSVSFTLGVGTASNADAELNKPVTTAIAIDNTNYELIQPAGITVNISPLPVTIIPDSGQKKIRHETDPVFTFTAEPELFAGSSFTGALSRETGEAVGAYNFTLGSLSAGNNYELALGGTETFEITKAIPSYTAPTGLTATYGDLLSDVDLSLFTGWAWDAPTDYVGDAGIRVHSATFTPADTANYSNVTVDLSLTVAKAEQTGFAITDPGVITFGDAFVMLETVGGQSTDDTVTWALTGGNAVTIAENTGIITTERIGTVIITATKAGDDNYNEVTAALTFTVEKRDLSLVSVEAIAGFIYTGLPLTPSPVVTDIAGSENLLKPADYTYLHGANTSVAGGGTITITATPTGNYTGEIIVNFAILPAPLTVTLDNISKLHAGDTPPFTYFISGFVNGENITTAEVTGAPERTTDYQQNNYVGNYTIFAGLGNLQAPNYEFTTFNNSVLSVLIAPQAPIFINGAPLAITYGDDAFPLSVSGGSVDGAAIQWAVTGGNGALTIDSAGRVTVVQTGTTTIRATKAGDNNFSFAEEYITLTVLPKNITADMFTVNSTVYNGTPQLPTVTPQLLNISAQEFVRGIDYGYTFSPQTNAGSYGFTISGIGNYGGSVNFNFVINKAPPALSDLAYSLTSVTFDNTQKAVSVTAASGVTGLGTIAVFYDGSTAPPINAKTYIITAEIAEGDNYTAASFTLGSFAINKATMSFPATSAVSAVYTPSLTLADISLPTGYVWTAPTTPLSAGNNQSFPAIYTDPSGNFEAVGGSIVVNVTKAAGNTTTDAVTVTYSPTLTVGSAVSAFSDYTFADASTSLTVANNGLQVTGYKDNADPDNYGQDSIIITITVEPRSITNATVTASGTFIYTGNPHTPTPVVVVDGITLTAADFTYSHSANTGAGTATVTVTGIVNYTGTATGSFTIGKDNQGALSINPPGALTFGDAPITLTTSGGDGTGAVTFAVTQGNATITGNQLTITGAGSVTVTAVKAGDDNFFVSDTATLTFTVNARSIAGATVSAISPFTFTSGAIQPQPSVSDGATTLILNTHYTLSYSNNTDAGSTAEVIITGIGNYTGTVTVNFTINAATPTVATPPTASTMLIDTALSTSALSGGVVNGVSGQNNLAGAWAWETPTATVGASGS
ncbi:MAG: YDG domain-containing protein, partial [Oscillospiraceae bacterium]|nr:YDG domain-containing protein [Oscillospiraceae bacterium]